MDDPAFPAVLAGFKHSDSSCWDEQDPAQAPFALAKLDGYYFIGNSLQKKSRTESFSEELNSLSNAKKSKLSLTDAASSNDSQPSVVTVLNKEWLDCQRFVRGVEDNLQTYTKVIQNLKEIQVKLRISFCFEICFEICLNKLFNVFVVFCNKTKDCS